VRVSTHPTDVVPGLTRRSRDVIRHNYSSRQHGMLRSVAFASGFKLDFFIVPTLPGVIVTIENAISLLLI
jgi:hypothetical protein